MKTYDEFLEELKEMITKSACHYENIGNLNFSCEMKVLAEKIEQFETELKQVDDETNKA